MYRCRIEKTSWDGAEVTPAPGEMERLRRVLRLKDGDRVNVFDGHGRSGWARFTVGTQDGMARLRPIQGGAVRVAAPLPVILFQSIPKASRMDWLIEKATELGAAEIVPLVTERGIVRPASSSQAGNRLTRWRRLAREAARQCGMATVPHVGVPLDFQEALRQVADRSLPGLYGSLEADTVSWRQVFEGWPDTQAARALFIGPEGDFTPQEAGRLRAAGMIPVSLGPRILRVETAALAALCVIGYEFARRDGDIKEKEHHGISGP